MTTGIPKDLESLCQVLVFPVLEVTLISEVLPSIHRSVQFDTAPVDGTFLCLSCETKPKQMAVFFLGESNDEIKIRITNETDREFESLLVQIQEENPELDAVCMTSLSQLVNPVFNSGSEKLTYVIALVARCSSDDERLVGLILGFPFGIRLGLHIYDDHRLSLCFNETCDEILSQARKHPSVQIFEIPLHVDDKPSVAEIDWFDWLK